MELRLSVATSDRFFDKAMRRIRPSLKPIMNGFSLAVPSRSTCDAILVGITDDKPSDYVEEVANNEAFFQVLFGCPYPVEDSELLSAVFERLISAVRACPMSEGDSIQALKYLESWRGSLSE